jgi:hypothetical protein
MKRLILVALCLLLSSTVLAGGLFVGYTPPGQVVPYVSLSPTSWIPSSGVQGATTATQTITVTSIGNATLSGITLDGSIYFVDAGTGSCTASSNLSDSSCEIDLEFDYTLAGGPYSGTLTVTSNATDSPQSTSLGPVTVEEVTACTWVYPGDLTVSTGIDGSASVDSTYARGSGQMTANGTVKKLSVHINSVGTATEASLALYSWQTFKVAGKLSTLTTGWNDIDVTNTAVNATDLIAAIIPNGTITLSRDTASPGGYYKADTYTDPMDWPATVLWGQATTSNWALRMCVE